MARVVGVSARGAGVSAHGAVVSARGARETAYECTPAEEKAEEGERARRAGVREVRAADERPTKGEARAQFEVRPFGGEAVQAQVPALGSGESATSGEVRGREGVVHREGRTSRRKRSRGAAEAGEGVGAP